MLKDLLFALSLGMRVITSFVLCIYVGIKLDVYFDTQGVCILIGILVAFVYVMKLLLGEIRRE